MRKTRNLDAARCALVSSRRLGAAFPLAAAADLHKESLDFACKQHVEHAVASGKTGIVSAGV